jgi:hypothetical protein
MIYDPGFGIGHEFARPGETILVFMGNYNDPAKPVTTETAASPGALSKPAAASPKATNGDGAPAKAAVKKKPAKKAAKKVVTYSTEDIALRAYFISEHRHRHGIHGDAHSDWVKAERELKAEQRKAAKKTPQLKKRK